MRIEGEGGPGLPESLGENPFQEPCPRGIDALKQQLLAARGRDRWVSRIGIPVAGVALLISVGIMANSILNNDA